MKPFASGLAVAISLLASALPAAAQGPVSTGTVMSVEKQAGVMVLNSAQTNKPVTFFGLEKSKVMSAAGPEMTLGDLKPGMLVSVHYQPVGDRWMVGRIVIPSDTPSPVPAATPFLTTKESAEAKSKVATDNDRTTNPGIKARVDGDRTTQPGRKDPADPDITKRGDNK